LEAVLKKRGNLLTSEKRRFMGICSHAVGPQIAAQTSPDRLQKGSLFVKTSGPAWMQQLHFLKDEIIDKINRQMGKGFIKNIFFSIGEVSPLPSKLRDPAASFSDSFSLKGKDKKEIEQHTASVPDPELKEILKRVMTKDIIRRKLRGTQRVP
jgi:hypothetical protein